MSDTEFIERVKALRVVATGLGFGPNFVMMPPAVRDRLVELISSLQARKEG